MAKPKIGCEYRLDIPEKIRGEAIPWVNNRSKTLFKALGEIDGRIVTVKAFTRVMTIFYIVALLDHPKDTFFIPTKRLMELTRRLPIPCSCDLKLLLSSGCSCGAFKKEQSQKPK